MQELRMSPGDVAGAATGRPLARWALAPMLTLMLGLAVVFAQVLGLRAADRGKLEAFLTVTGFDVALDSIALSARNAPAMLGMSAEDFGYQWTTATQEVFDSDKMQGMALEILSQTLSDDLLDHAAAFYATPLGLRLVEVENAAHMEDDDAQRDADGAALIEALRTDDPDRVALLKRMNDAIDSSNTAVRAVQEIQVRFLLAAAHAGVLDLKVDEGGLRAMLKGSEAELAASLEKGALENAALTYRDFTQAELLAYAEALEDPKMQKVYDLMNAIQWEVMANRFEALAVKMGGMQPAQEL